MILYKLSMGFLFKIRKISGTSTSKLSSIMGFDKVILMAVFQEILPLEKSPRCTHQNAFSA
jgi:hypothetical protein